MPKLRDDITHEDVMALRRQGLSITECANRLKVSKAVIIDRIEHVPPYEAEFSHEKDSKRWSELLEEIKWEIHDAYTRGFADGSAAERKKYVRGY